MLFQPCEDACRVLFSRLVVSADSSGSALPECLSVFRIVMKFVVLVGVVFVSFGSAFTGVGVRLLLGARWADTEVPTVLAIYCAYVVLLALNGMAEVIMCLLSCPVLTS
jgi:oligosaccharide translocation protein RFT1